MIDLDKLQEMWEKDSKIDMDNLHTESTNIPTLHAKYFEMYNTIFLLRKKAEQQKKNIRHERYEYFSGKADPDVYIENPFPKKIRDKDTMQKYLLIHFKLDVNDIHLIYRSLNKMLETWPGGHPAEQERLYYLKDFVYRIILEYKFKMD